MGTDWSINTNNFENMKLQKYPSTIFFNTTSNAFYLFYFFYLKIKQFENLYIYIIFFDIFYNKIKKIIVLNCFLIFS